MSPRLFPVVKKTVIEEIIGGSGPNPSDAFSLGVRAADTSAAPTDAASFAFTFPDSSATPSDLVKLGLTYGDTNAELADLLLRLGLGLTDTISLPTDAATFAMNLAQADTVAAQTETAKLNIRGLGDSNTVPTDTRSALVKLWGSGSAGTGVTSPANADGPNSGTPFATISTAAAGPTTETLTSNCGNAVAAGTPFPTSIIFRGWYRLQTTLSTSTARVLVHSSSAAFTDIVIETLAATAGDLDHLTTPFVSADLAGTINTLAKLQSAQIQYQTTDAAAGVSPAIVTADAGSFELTGVI
jgi:hypothetical protein